MDGEGKRPARLARVAILDAFRASLAVEREKWLLLEEKATEMHGTPPSSAEPL